MHLFIYVFMYLFFHLYIYLCIYAFKHLFIPVYIYLCTYLFILKSGLVHHTWSAHLPNNCSVFNIFYVMWLSDFNPAANCIRKLEKWDTPIYIVF